MSEPATVIPLAERPHVLYRMYDSEDRMLYVGITMDIHGRFRQHRETKRWWRVVDTIRLTHFSNRRDALAEEARVIAEEKPVHNQRRGHAIDESEKAMPRPFRVRNRTWWDFKAAVGTNKVSYWLTPYVEAIALNAQQWKEFRAIAEARGDSFAEAMVKAMRLYRVAE